VVERKARRYSSNWRRMNSSEPMKPIVLGREGLFSSQVSWTVCDRKSIQRLSAAESAKAVRRDDDVMLMVVSSS